MAGPLHWFRKKQKLLLGIFGVGLMLVFTISVGSSGVDPIIDRLSGGGPSGGEDPVAVQWDGGELLETQLEQLRVGRNLLRYFLFTVRQVATDRGGVSRVSMLPVYSGDRSLLELEILASEAEKLGVEVGDKAVLDYLNQLTDGTVDASEYGELLRTSTRGNLSESQLFGLVARELKAQKVRGMVQSGGYPSSPIAAWDYYNRLNRFVKAEMVPISVDDYLDQVKEPGEAEISELYEKYKDRYPLPLSPEPGFRRREKRAFEYVKVDFDAILAAEKAKVTDEEVSKYYEENKEQYRKGSPDDLELELNESDPRLKDSAESAEVDSDQSAESVVDEDAAKANETPTADPNPSPTALPQADTTDDKEAEAATPETESPAETASDGTASQEKAEGTTTDDASLTDDSSAAEEGPAGESPTEKPAEPTGPTDEGASEETEENAAPDTASVVEPSDLEPAAADEPYESLENVAEEIRQTIARPRAQAKMNEIISDVRRKLDIYHQDYTLWEIESETNPDATKSEPPKASTFASSDEAVSGEVPLIDAFEAADYEIGQAFDLRFSQGQGGVQRIMFAETAFSEKTDFYTPQVVPDIDVAINRFVYWMTDGKEEYVPELAEIRDEVVQAYKRQQALGLAEEDAKKMADKVRQQNATLSESLAERENLEFIDTGEISWVTAPLMEGSSPQITVIPGAEDAGPELREKLFRLEPGEVDYAANMPKNKVYVFRVDEVTPDLAQRRDQFLRNGVDAPLLFLARRDSLLDLSEWYRNLTDKYGIDWKREPRSGEGSQL